MSDEQAGSQMEEFGYAGGLVPAALRCVTTGVNENGRSCTLNDARPGFAFGAPGVITITPLHRTVGGVSTVPLSKSGPGGGAPPSADLSPGEIMFAIMEIMPGDAFDAQAKDASFNQALASSLDRAQGKRHPGMHATDTIDFSYLIEGELTLLLDEEDVVLKAGDVLVQGGGNHHWINHGDKPAKVAAVLLGAKRGV